jgi:uncharacterized protein YkwD
MIELITPDLGMLGKLLYMHNQQRRSPLVISDKLMTAAQKYAGTRPRVHGNYQRRISAEGYRWRTVGENLAIGQRTVEEVMKSWLNSPGHRSNIQNPAFKEVGFGMADYYWIVDFGAT